MLRLFALLCAFCIPAAQAGVSIGSPVGLREGYGSATFYLYTADGIWVVESEVDFKERLELPAEVTFVEVEVKEAELEFTDGHFLSGELLLSGPVDGEFCLAELL